MEEDKRPIHGDIGRAELNHVLSCLSHFCRDHCPRHSMCCDLLSSTTGASRQQYHSRDRLAGWLAGCLENTAITGMYMIYCPELDTQGQSNRKKESRNDQEGMIAERHIETCRDEDKRAGKRCEKAKARDRMDNRATSGNREGG